MVCARRRKDRPDRKTPTLALVNDEPEERRGLARGSGAETVPDHQPQVVGRDLDQVALLDVPGTAQPGAAQAADVEDEGEAALDLFGAQFESLAGLFSRARLLYRRAASSPCQRAKAFCSFSEIRLFQALSSSAFTRE